MSAANNITYNWLFGQVTPYCDASLVYSTAPSDLAPRIIMAAIWVASVVCILLMPKSEHSHLAKEEDPAAGSTAQLLTGPSPTGGRWLMLDVLRIACLTCIVVEHQAQGSVYSTHNVVFVAQWVLPALLLTSGVAFMQSRSGAHHYLLRLAAVFIVGVLCNMLADAITRPEWWHDFGNTVFQMFYVVAIAFLGIFSMPLRAILRTCGEPKGASSFCELPNRIVCFACAELRPCPVGPLIILHPCL